MMVRDGLPQQEQGMPYGSQSGINLNGALQVGMFMAACVRSKQEIQHLSQTPCSLLTHAAINMPTWRGPFGFNPKWLRKNMFRAQRFEKVLKIKNKIYRISFVDQF